MIITRQSILSGIVREMDFDITEGDLQDWKDGALIQDVMPHLTSDEREFIMTGITPDEWDAMVSEEEK